jgi:hypothetical protein
MTAQSIVCGTCAAAVPYGRLSCPSCGELLASVAGARRTAGRTNGRRAMATATAAADPLENGPATGEAVIATIPAAPELDPALDAPAGYVARLAAAAAPEAGMPDVLYEPAAAPSPVVVEGDLESRSGRDVDDELPWTTGASPAVDEGPDDGADDDTTDDDAPLAFSANGPASSSGTGWTADTVPSAGSITPAYMPRPALRPPTPVPAASFAGPGAYVPPLPMTVTPAGPPAPARAWVGFTPDQVATDTPVAAGAAETAPAAKTSVDARARFAEFVGWLFVAGAAFSAVGFLLPWGQVMIGSSGVGYFDRWGLAGPAHVLLVLGLLVVLALALVRNDVPVWIRTGLTGLGLGALLFGLVWPYLIGPLGSGPGALIVAVGSAALAVSGILALVADRHEGVGRSV